MHVLRALRLKTMKQQADPRHQKRREIVQKLFAASYQDKHLGGQTRAIWKARAQIDPIIVASAPEWPLEKLNKTDLAILRLAVFELIIEKKEPVRVIIDEAVELGKEFGSENSPSFVNGVLGTIVKKEKLEQDGPEEL